MRIRHFLAGAIRNGIRVTQEHLTASKKLLSYTGAAKPNLPAGQTGLPALSISAASTGVPIARESPLGVKVAEVIP